MRWSAVWLLGLWLVVAGCTSSASEGSGQAGGRVIEAPGGGTGDAEDRVEVFAPYRDGEADAFRAVLDDFTAQTGVPTRYVGSSDFAGNLTERVRAGDPPEVAIIPQPAVLEQLARDGHLEPIDGVVGDVDGSLLPGAADVGVVDGTRYGVWYRMVVKSLVWYPPTAFEEAGYELPSTWQELLALTRRIEADGQVPWCMGMEAFGATGWVGTDWVEDLVLRLHGPDVYDAWAAGEIPFTDERIAEAFEEFGTIALTGGRVLGGTRAILATPALDAVLPMLDQPPRCLLSRQASFQEDALPLGTQIGPQSDLDVFVLPGTQRAGDGAGGSSPTQPPLVAGGGIAVSFTNDAEALALVAALAQPGSGEAWAERGGFVSPHATFDPTAYGSDFQRRLARMVAEAPVVRFDASDEMPPAVGTGTFWEGMVSYVAGTPLPDILPSIQSGYGPDRPDARGGPTGPSAGAGGDADAGDGAVGDGAVDDGAVDDGAVGDGAVGDGAVDDGAVDDEAGGDEAGGDGS